MKAKQVIVWRHDLKVRLGKKKAQAGHAALMLLSNKIRESLQPDTVRLTPVEQAWFLGNFRKIVLLVDSEDELMEIYEKAQAAGLNVDLVTDSGLTEFNGVPTRTCLAIGPDLDEKINQVTGHLRPA